MKARLSQTDISLEDAIEFSPQQVEHHWKTMIAGAGPRIPRKMIMICTPDGNPQPTKENLSSILKDVLS